MDLKIAEEKLNKTKADLEKELKGLEGIPDMGSDVESGNYDQETDEAEAYSNNLSIRDALKKRLQAVEKALEKIKAGTYGKCENCGANIPDEVLEVNPEATHCKNCSV